MSERYFYTEGSFSDDLRIVERTGMNSTQVIASVGVRTKYIPENRRNCLRRPSGWRTRKT